MPSDEKHDAPRSDLLGDDKLRREIAVDARRTELVRAQEEAVPLQTDDRLAIGTGLLIGIGAWLGLGSIWIYPTTIAGQNGSVRDALVSVVVVSCGLRMRLGFSPSLVAAGLAVLSGIVLLAFGLLADHSSLGAQIQEIACAVLILLGAALAARPPASRS